MFWTIYVFIFLFFCFNRFSVYIALNAIAEPRVDAGRNLRTNNIMLKYLHLDLYIITRSWRCFISFFFATRFTYTGINLRKFLADILVYCVKTRLHGGLQQCTPRRWAILCWRSNIAYDNITTCTIHTGCPSGDYTQRYLRDNKMQFPLCASLGKGNFVYHSLVNISVL